MAEWFGLSERKVNWVRSAGAGNDEDGYSEVLLGVDEEGWFPLRVRASEYESAVLDGEVFEPTSDESRVESVAEGADHRRASNRTDQ